MSARGESRWLASASTLQSNGTKLNFDSVKRQPVGTRPGSDLVRIVGYVRAQPLGNSRASQARAAGVRANLLTTHLRQSPNFTSRLIDHFTLYFYISLFLFSSHFFFHPARPPSTTRARISHEFTNFHFIFSFTREISLLYFYLQFFFSKIYIFLMIIPLSRDDENFFSAFALISSPLGLRFAHHRSNQLAASIRGTSLYRSIGLLANDASPGKMYVYASKSHG